MLGNVDALVFDIQDVGVRQYTYLSTNGLAMQAAAKENPDRNPRSAGSDRRNDRRGKYPRAGHGVFRRTLPDCVAPRLTAGEPAGRSNKEFGIGADLTSSRSQGWKRALVRSDRPAVDQAFAESADVRGRNQLPRYRLLRGTNPLGWPRQRQSSRADLSRLFRAGEVAGLNERAASRRACPLPVAADFAVLPTARKYGGQTVYGVRMDGDGSRDLPPDRDDHATLIELRHSAPAPQRFPEWRHTRSHRRPPSRHTASTRLPDPYTGQQLRMALDTLLAEWDRDSQ